MEILPEWFYDLDEVRKTGVNITLVPVTKIDVYTIFYRLVNEQCPGHGGDETITAITLSVDSDIAFKGIAFYHNYTTSDDLIYAAIYLKMSEVGIRDVTLENCLVAIFTPKQSDYLLKLKY